MTILDTERVSATRQLLALADDARAERKLWKDRQSRNDLAHIARQLERAARASLHHDVHYADAWLEAGRSTLRRFINHRRFINSLAGTYTPYVTLDCRDGRHSACETCACRHHWSTR